MTLTSSYFLRALLLSLLSSALASKHTFKTKKDGRFLIGPIGAPFGFQTGGRVKINIFNFRLSERHNHGKETHVVDYSDPNFEYDRESHFEAGFLLKRFDTESDFAKFEEGIVNDPFICSYEPFRESSNRRLDMSFSDAGMDDIFDSYGYDYDDGTSNQAEEGEDGYDEDVTKYLPMWSIKHWGKVMKGENEGGAASVKPPAKYAAVQGQSMSRDGMFLSMKDIKLWNISPKMVIEGNANAPSFEHTFTYGEEGLYYLIYQVCPIGKSALFSEVRSTFSVTLNQYNIDALGKITHLTAGETHLPLIFFFFSVSYGVLLFVWLKALKGENVVSGERNLRVQVRQIHHLMTGLLIIKIASVFLESVRYHAISVNGHAEILSFVYYAMSFFRGFMLFTVILLIGSGWSIVKPFLQQREKKLILFVLVLQVLDNLAIVVLLNETEGERQYEDWKAIMHLVDILCCCLVLVPIVWQIGAIEKDAENSENMRILEKLKLFRSFYLLVVAYIYFTRVIVYLVSSSLGYEYTWLGHFLSELGTIAFYVTVGYKFRPSDEKTNYDMVSKEDLENLGGPEIEVMMTSKKAED